MGEAKFYHDSSVYIPTEQNLLSYITQLSFICAMCVHIKLLWCELINKIIMITHSLDLFINQIKMLSQLTQLSKPSSKPVLK